jgi:hypothetical protein
MAIAQKKARCLMCGSTKGFIEVHGSMACLNCKTKIISCCGDDGCII